MLLVLGPDRRVRRINRAGAAILGAPAEAIIGHDWVVRFVPERLRGRAAAVLRALAEGGVPETWDAESPVLRADGTERLVAWRTAVLRDAEGRFAGTLSSGEEVTERRRAEAALRASEERLRLAQEAGDVGTWEWDIAAGTLHWSAGCHRLHGTDPARPIDYATWWNGIHPGDQPAVQAILEGALEGRGTAWMVEFRFTRLSDGAERCIVGRGEVVRDTESGRALRLLGVALDVTARREAEAAARAGEERLRLALAAAEMGVWEYDLRHSVGTRSGPLAERLPVVPGAGFPLEDWLAPMHPDDRARLEAAFRDAVEGRAPQFAAEFRVRRPDGTGWTWVAS
jgi:PAS domain S-box-containing protein